MKNLREIINEEVKKQLAEYAEQPFKDDKMTEELRGYCDNMQNQLNDAVHSGKYSKRDIIILTWQDSINRLRHVAEMMSTKP
jgi:hypothetical protein